MVTQAFLKNQWAEVFDGGVWIAGKVLRVNRDCQHRIVSYFVQTAYGNAIYWPNEVRRAQGRAA